MEHVATEVNPQMGLVRWKSHQSVQRYYRQGVGVAVLGLLAWAGVATDPAAAVRFADGTVQFAGVPLLGKVSTTDNHVWAWGATYFFTVKVPADASEPLGRVVLQQKEGVDSVSFNLKRTYAYLAGDRHQRVSVEASNSDKDSIEIRFTEPVPPGSTVTLGLRPYNNPDTGGVYLFGVTTFPQGDKVRGQFIGYGRLQFYENSFFRSWGWP
ncbi:MAG TPA: DUF2808 domain-containing protein [Stenomitos sp.]